LEFPACEAFMQESTREEFIGYGIFVACVIVAATLTTFILIGLNVLIRIF
jgi:hypothetical protein